MTDEKEKEPDDKFAIFDLIVREHTEQLRWLRWLIKTFFPSPDRPTFTPSVSHRFFAAATKWIDNFAYFLCYFYGYWGIGFHERKIPHPAHGYKVWKGRGCLETLHVSMESFERNEEVRHETEMPIWGMVVNY